MRGKYTRKYTKTWWIDDWEHRWEIVGRYGGVHLHLRSYKTGNGESRNTSGGVECHHRTPPEYMEEQAPSQINCALINGPCWHDGSSMYATEYFVPLFLAGGPNVDEAIFAELERWAADRLEPEKDKR